MAAEFGLRGWKRGRGQAAPEGHGQTSKTSLRSLSSPGHGWAWAGPALALPACAACGGLAVPWAGVSTQPEGPQVPDGAKTVLEGPIYLSGCAPCSLHPRSGPLRASGPPCTGKLRRRAHEQPGRGGCGGVSYLTSGPAYLSTQQDWTGLRWRVVVTQTSRGWPVFPFPVSCLGWGGGTLGEGRAPQLLEAGGAGPGPAPGL